MQCYHLFAPQKAKETNSYRIVWRRKIELENYPLPGKELVPRKLIFAMNMYDKIFLFVSPVNLPQLHCNLMLLGVLNWVF